jgi:predicted lipoprotein with Yx(FWY)xxD motif
MPRFRTIASLILAAGLIVAGCSSAATPAPASTAPSAAGGNTVTVASMSTSLGTVLTGPTGMTLYIHAGDSATTSTCTGGCATAWPPLTVSTGGSAVGGTGVTGTFATLTRDDGSIQVTYAGMPLYYWQADAKAGDTTGQNVNGFTVATVGGSGAAASPEATKPGY